MPQQLELQTFPLCTREVANQAEPFHGLIQVQLAETSMDFIALSEVLLSSHRLQQKFSGVSLLRHSVMGSSGTSSCM